MNMTFTAKLQPTCPKVATFCADTLTFTFDKEGKSYEIHLDIQGEQEDNSERDGFDIRARSNLVAWSILCLTEDTEEIALYEWTPEKIEKHFSKEELCKLMKNGRDFVLGVSILSTTAVKDCDIETDAFIFEKGHGEVVFEIGEQTETIGFDFYAELYD